MNQPKFKFGDRVQRTKGYRHDDQFIIMNIALDENGKYWYGEKSHTRYGENSLELYQEPKKKKLYAYKAFYTASSGSTRFNGDVIRFFSNVNIEEFSTMQQDWKRAPEYDLEYPSEEVK